MMASLIVGENIYGMLAAMDIKFMGLTLQEHL
jgi:hypothetical protein